MKIGDYQAEEQGIRSDWPQKPRAGIGIPLKSSSDEEVRYLEDYLRRQEELLGLYERMEGDEELDKTEKANASVQKERVLGYIQRARSDLKRNMTGVAGEGGELERGVALKGIIGLVCLIVGGFFLSSNITGNVIGNLTQNSSNWIGGVLGVVGIVVIFFYFKRN